LILNSYASNNFINYFLLNNFSSDVEYINNTNINNYQTYLSTTNKVNPTNNISNFTEIYCLNNLNNFFNNQLTSEKNFNSYYDFLRLDETSDSTGNLRTLSATTPFRLIKGILNQHNISVINSVVDFTEFNKLLFLQFKIIKSGELNKDKELIPETLWGFRQKKYKRIKKFNFKPQSIYDPVTFKVLGFNNTSITSAVDIAGVDLSYSLLKKDKKLNYSNLYNYYLSMKINRNKTELVPITLARRLLRTKRTLVLPAHVNLTVITNSYDVVHS
jgi:hypothetical protein